MTGEPILSFWDSTSSVLKEVKLKALGELGALLLSSLSA
jgi:hypothetical protein